MPSLRACGARPSAGMGYPGSDGLAGRCPEITRRAISSEGRGLRAREYGPDGSRGLSFRIHALTMARWAIGNMPRSSPCLPRGRAEPAPPRNGQAKAKTPYGGRPGDDAKGGFLGGTHSVRPPIRAGRKPGHNMIIGGKRTPGGQMGTCSGEANSVVAGVRSPPLDQIQKPMWMVISRASCP